MALQLDRRRRWFGLLYLILSGGLLIWGLTWLRPVLAGIGFAVYWLLCLGFALAALVIAWLDWRSIRRQVRRQQQELLTRTLHVLPPPGPPAAQLPTPSPEAGPPSESASRPEP